MIKLLVAPVVAAAAFAIGGAAANASSWAIDCNGDGWNEGTAWDNFEDGYADVERCDTSGNGTWDLWRVDDDNDGWIDRYVWDINENNVADDAEVASTDIYAAIQGATVVGPATSPGAFLTLATTGASVLGTPTFGSTTDYDVDGCYDHLDPDPYSSDVWC